MNTTMRGAIRTLIVVLGCALAATACGTQKLHLQSRWYLVEPPTKSESSTEEGVCSEYLEMFLAVVNWEQPVVVEALDIGGMKHLFPGRPNAWNPGEVREYDLGPFECFLPTNLRVKVNGQWLDSGSITGQMPSSLPACVQRCPGCELEDPKDTHCREAGAR